MNDKCTTLANGSDIKRGRQTYYLGEVVLHTTDYAVENTIRESLLNEGFDVEVEKDSTGINNIPTKIRIRRTV